MRRALLALVAIGVAAALAGGFLLRNDLRQIDFTRLPTRASWQRPERVVAALELEPGDRVADLGSGDGYFTFRLAEAVGTEGRVYAVDVDANTLAEVKREAQSRGLDNVITVEAEPSDPLLPDGEVDLVFLCNTYHHLSRRPDYFARLRRDLAPNGRVAVVEPLDAGLAVLVNPPGHATPVDQVRDEMATAGYHPVASFDFLPVQSLEIFGR
jgi:ubiquinone/menaquinone biosynthesis C-methylase UbiE